MTVIRPNSIAGINSITVQSGQALNVHDATGNLIRSLTNESGISTFSGINVGTAATIKANGNATFSGIVTASAADLQTGPLNVGTAATISANGNATFSGIITATKFVGSFDGSSVTGTSGAFTGNIDLNSDTNKLKIGAGDDFQFYHNGSNNFIETNNGDIRIKTSDGSGNLTFTAGGSNESVRISSAGMVGVNTDSPTLNGNEEGIHIVSDNYPTLHLTNATTQHAAGNGSMFTLNNTGETIIRNGHNSHIRFDTNGSNERLRIGASGEIGIAGANYGTAGQVLTSGGSGAAVSWGAAGGNVKQVVYNSTTSTFNSSSSSFVETPCNITITPTVSSSKIYIQLSPAIWSGSGQYTHYEVRASGGASGVIVSFGDFYTGYYGNTLLQGVHTGHNTTSAITYTIWGRSDGASWYCPNNNSDSDIDQRYTGIAWEVIV